MSPTSTTASPFTYDEGSAARDYAERGWIHLTDCVGEDLMNTLTDQVAGMLGGDADDLGAWRYPEKKSQFLLDLPAALLNEVTQAVARTTGLDPETALVSERHLKVYSATAPAMPPAHKDRSASTVTVGIGIDIPADSRLVLWPDVDTTYNPFPTAAEWRETRHDHELPEYVTDAIDPVEVDLRRGDVVMFRGANLYHERIRPANTAVLYLKFNDMGLDPLGEDPSTVAAEQRTADVLESGIDAATVVRRSPRLVGLRTDELYPDLGTVVHARTIESERAVRLNDDDVTLLRLVRVDAVRVGDAVVGPSVVERMARAGLVLLD